MVRKSLYMIPLVLFLSFLFLRLSAGTSLQSFAMLGFFLTWVPVGFVVGGWLWWLVFKNSMNLFAAPLKQKPLDDRDLKRTFGIKAPMVKPGDQGQVIDMTGRFNRKN